HILRQHQDRHHCRPRRSKLAWAMGLCMAKRLRKNLNWLRTTKPHRPSEFTSAWPAMVAVLMLAQNVALASRAPGPDAFGYTVGQTSAYSFTNIVLNYPTNGSVRTLSFNDDESVTVNIGFTFNFYGSNYSKVS